MAQVLSPEQTILDILRKLPVDRQKQVVDFARFLEFQEPIKESEGDAQWERLFASEKSEKFLSKMAEEVRKELGAGKGRAIIIKDGELQPE